MSISKFQTTVICVHIVAFGLLVQASATPAAAAAAPTGLPWQLPNSIPAPVAGQFAHGDIDGNGTTDVVAISNTGSLISFAGDGLGNFGVPLTSSMAGQTPTFVALGDVNGDGKLDAVANSSLSSNFYTMIGNGQGSFQPGPVGNRRPASMKLCKLNADDRLDLVIQEDYKISLFLGNGDGSFAFLQDLDYNSGPNCIAVTDFDGDGDNDIVHGSSAESSAKVYFYANNGNGTMAPRVASVVANIAVGIRSIFAADFNKDGKTDLAALSDYDTVTTLTGLGNGTFAANAPGALESYTSAITGGDFDGDGSVDLAVTWSSAYRVRLFKNEGGRFGAVQPQISQPSPYSVLTDFDGDGKDDLAIIAGGALQVLPGNTSFIPAPALISARVNGNLFNGELIDLNGDNRKDLVQSHITADMLFVHMGLSSGRFGPPTGYAAGDGPDGVAGADFNGDGKMDVAYFNRLTNSKNCHVRLGDGTGLLSAPIVVTPPSTSRSVAVGDVDRDGDIDLVFANALNSQFSIHLNSGAATFPTSLVVPTLGGPNIVRIGDLNRDGTPDFVVSCSYPGIAVHLSSGPLTYIRSDYAATDSPLELTLADMDGDGDIDIIRGSITTGPEYYLNTGSGAFVGPRRFSGLYAPNNLQTRGIAVDDVDGDSFPDVLLRTTTPDALTLLRGQSGGGFLPPASSYGPNGAHGKCWLADLDADGDPDPVFSYFDDPASEVISFAKTASPRRAIGFGALTGTPMSDCDKMIRADFNHDGRDDIIAVMSGGFGGWTADTTGTLTPTFSLPAGGATLNGLVQGDFNRDGRPDFASLDPAASRVAIALGSTTGPVSVMFTTSTLSAPPNAVAAADFNRDGRPDLCLALADSRLAFLPGNGAAAFGTPVVTATGSAVVRISAGDFNRDGRQDIAALEPTAALMTFYAGNGAGGFALTSSTAVGPGATFFVLADLDADGCLDAVIAETSGVRTLSGNPMGGFSVIAGGFAPLIAPTTQMDVSDLNRDGRPDVVVCAGGSVLVFRNTGSGVLAPPVVVGTPFPAARATVAMLGADGRPDLAVYMPSAGTLLPLSGKGGSFSLPTASTAPALIPSGSVDDVLSITLVNHGVPGDVRLGLSNLELAFLIEGGDAATSAQINAVVAEVLVYADNGDGIFSSASDRPVARASGLAPNSLGRVTIPVPVRESWSAAPEGSFSYFVAVRTTPDANLQVPATLQIVHVTEASSTVGPVGGGANLSGTFIPNTGTGPVALPVALSGFTLD